MGNKQSKPETSQTAERTTIEEQLSRTVQTEEDRRKGYDKNQERALCRTNHATRTAGVHQPRTEPVWQAGSTTQ